MDSVNPVILVTAGTAVVGLLAAMSVCMKNAAPAPKETASTHKAAAPSAAAKTSPAVATTAAVAPSEGKKKKKPKKKAASGAELLQDQLQELDEDEISMQPTPVAVPPKIEIVPQATKGKSKAKSPTPVTANTASGTYAAASASKFLAAASAAIDSTSHVQSPAPVPEPVPSAPAPAPATKSKSKAKAAAAPVEPAAVVPAAAPVPVPKKAVESVTNSKSEKIDELAIYRFEAGIDDSSWNVVEDKRKAKFLEKTKQPKPTEKAAVQAVDSAAGASVAPAAPVVETTTAQVTVDAKKVGIIIGPKGATLKAIQEATGVQIQTPKDRDRDAKGDEQVSISITGQAEGVAAATKIVNDLSVKGYAAALEGEDFSEGFASVHPTHVMDLIGKGGAVRKAIQDHTGVKISVPANVSREQTANVRVGLAGVKGKVTEAKKIIKELIKYKHHPVTHPGLVHQELDVPSALYNVIIGARGSEIKQIQGNYKVSVHIPNEHSPVQAVLIVGEQKGVDGAVKYIQKILEQATRDRTAAVDTAEIWAEAAAARAESDDVTEEWMQEFVHPSKRKPIVADALATVTPAAPVQTNAGAWGAGVVTAAEGW